MKVKLVLIIIFFLKLSPSWGFDHVLHLEKKIFYPNEFNFNITKVIDARISREEPVGEEKKGIKHKVIGNINLEIEFRSFISDSIYFRRQNPVLLVINQVNFRPMPGEQGFVLCFDYYKSIGDSLQLIFSQTTKSTMEAAINSGNGIDKSFTWAVEKALLDFKNQLYFYKPFPAFPLLQKDLGKLLSTTNKQVPDSLKDGLYFNINQLLNNTPALPIDELYTDSALVNNSTLTFSTSAYNIKLCYAVVKKRQLYLYLYRNIYYPATRSGNKLYLPKAYEPENTSPSTYHSYQNTTTDIAIALIFIILDHTNNSLHLQDIIINQQTGQLTL